MRRRALVGGVALAVLLALSGCGWSLPPAECAPGTDTPAVELPCDRAVREAAYALPDDPAPITRVQYVNGTFDPAYCSMLLPNDDQRVCSHVVFTFADGSRSYVQLVLANGRLAVSSPWPE